MSFYKVVRRFRYDDGDQFASVYAAGKAAVEYVPGQWAEPPAFLKERGYGLFVYADEADAHLAAADAYGGEVWECEAENVRPVPLGAGLDLGELKEGRFVPAASIEPRSLWADRVRLLRPVTCEIFYKVVRRENYRLYSLWAEGPARVAYYPDIIVKSVSPGYGFCVTPSLETAVAIANDAQGLGVEAEIWVVDGIGEDYANLPPWVEGVAPGDPAKGWDHYPDTRMVGAIRLLRPI
jgi:hypothetical protein